MSWSQMKYHRLPAHQYTAGVRSISSFSIPRSWPLTALLCTYSAPVQPLQTSTPCSCHYWQLQHARPHGGVQQMQLTGSLASRQLAAALWYSVPKSWMTL
ncbi:hypothetical protein HBI56_132620 [Parastagonospora nodorum]|nr:hypothetical protein HBH56_035730 [Parastagonospora nodorum]KAH3933760.1 hypothetical protein HBH54_063730 [Parastagonospora nodorum]KAH3952576.1 hypothetical protein HBH53_046370 [Parastagonospora nodorum]KAH3979669.1 hypothetical protein HBH51_057390 [Parastagonospora nodorum]KAH3980406.1 hypothetical protein HBH52_093530 [Parastagonospora nodorum]